MKRIIFYILIIFLGINNLIAQNNSSVVDITITNIENVKGNINIVVYRNADEYESRKVFKKVVLSKSKLKNASLRYKLKLPPNMYGIAVVDDENSSGEIDKNFIGMPTEGFGFSNYYHTAMSKPKFDSFKFVLKKNETKKVKIKIRYL